MGWAGFDLDAGLVVGGAILDLTPQMGWWGRFAGGSWKCLYRDDEPFLGGVEWSGVEWSGVEWSGGVEWVMMVWVQ